MRKILLFLSAALTLFLVACDNSETMQEKLRKEKKAINAFIKMNNFDILDSYPKDGHFKENQFFRTSDGLYIQVVDSGNGKRVAALSNQVQVRFECFIDIKEYVSNSEEGTYYPNYEILPIQFMYGNTASYSEDQYGFACNGWALPLNYVGERAIVNLIIPSSMAGSSHSDSFLPLYYRNLQYTKFY